MVVVKKHHELYEELGKIVGAKYVSDDLAILLPYTRDMSSAPAEKPQGAVVLPGSVHEVVELVRLANQTRTPVIPMGGKASISGVPSGQPGRGIIVDMRRMDKVLEIDEVNMAVTAQCGITLGELAGKVHERGWDIPTADMPVYEDTIGGQISGFVGGGWSRYGHTLGYNHHYILGLKVVLPNGSVIDTGTGEGGWNTYRGKTWGRGLHGPDLTGMFISDGGMFGIKVEATYRMFRPPKFKKAGVRCWDSLDEAYQVLWELWEIDPYLYMQPYAKAIILSPEYVSMLAGVIPGLVAPEVIPTTWFLYWHHVGNSEEEIELKSKPIEAICAKHGGRAPEPAVAASFELFFTVEGTFEKEVGLFATKGQMPFFEFITSRRDLLEAHKWSREYVFNSLRKMRERGIDTSKVSLIGSLMPTGIGSGLTDYCPAFDQNDRELHRAIDEAFMEFMEQARRRGYVMEESCGREARLRAKSWTPEFYNQVLFLKKTLDPNNIMNPGSHFE